MIRPKALMGIMEGDQKAHAMMTKAKSNLDVGNIFGINAIYFFGYSSGIGLNYSRFSTSNLLMDTQLFNAAGEKVNGDLADNIAISYIGPSYAIRLISSNVKHSLTGCWI